VPWNHTKLRVARSAVRDLDEIWAYLAEKESIEVAERFVGLLTGRFSFLAKNPGVGRRRSELREGLRSFPVRNYRIYYRQEKKGIVRILYVRHAARDERKLFE
jgi:toxin ParE1/3/4